MQIRYPVVSGEEFKRTVKNVQSNLSIADMLYKGHLFVEPAGSRSNSHRKTPV